MSISVVPQNDQSVRHPATLQGNPVPATNTMQGNPRQQFSQNQVPCNESKNY